MIESKELGKVKKRVTGEKEEDDKGNRRQDLERLLLMSSRILEWEESNIMVTSI